MSYTRRAGDPPKWIPKEELVEGGWYRGHCRNATYAQWEDGEFHYTRHKFGNNFHETIPCPEDDRGFDVFFAFERILDVPKQETIGDSK